MPVCQICGKVFEKITWRHLKKHGLTGAEYRQKFCSEKAPPAAVAPDDVLGQLRNWMTTGQGMSDAALSTVENVMRSPEQRLRVVLSYLAVNQIGRLRNLLSAIDTAEGELFKPEKLKNANIWQLLRVSAQASQEVERITNLMQSLTQEQSQPFVDRQALLQQLPGKLVLPESPHDRLRLQQFIDRVARTVIELAKGTGTDPAKLIGSGQVEPGPDGSQK